MATGRIGVTPTLRTRWSKQPTAGTTSLSGLDDNSVALVYDVGYEAVYRNGALLSRGNDYTATTGTTVTLIDATLAGDIIEILANQLVPLTDAISKGQFNAKGALLSATAASTPGVLAVGANDTVLTADSTTSTGLKWATPAAGSMTLISTTTLSGASTTISSIDQTYKDLHIEFGDMTNATTAFRVSVKPNNSTTIGVWNLISAGSAPTNSGGTQLRYWGVPGGNNIAQTGAANAFVLDINNYASTTNHKPFNSYGSFVDNFADSVALWECGGIATNSAITSLVFECNTGYGTFNGGTVRIYGVK